MSSGIELKLFFPHLAGQRQRCRILEKRSQDRERHQSRGKDRWLASNHGQSDQNKTEERHRRLETHVAGYTNTMDFTPRPSGSA